MIEQELHEIPSNWVWDHLVDVADINPKLPYENINDNLDVSFLPMKTVEEETGRIDLSIVRKYGEVKKGYTRFIDNDILFAKITPCMENGKIAIAKDLVNGIGFGSTEFHVVRLRNDNLSEKFFFYYLVQKLFRRIAEQNMTGTVGQKRVPTDYIKDVFVPVPPAPEQVRIVFKLEELFSKLDAAVESLQRTKAQLWLYQQSLLKNAFEGGLTAAWRSENRHQKLQMPSRNLIEKSYEYIRSKRKKSGKRVYKALPRIDEEALPRLPNTWIWARTEELIYVIDYRGRTPPYSPKGIPHLRSSNIKDGKIIWEDLRYVSQETYERFMVRGISQQGDLLFTTEAPLGEVAFVPESKFSLAQRLMILRSNSSILDPRFLFYQIISPRFQGRLEGRGTGTTVTGVSYRNFRLLELAIPPLEEQYIIINELDREFSSIDRLTKEVELNLKKSSVMKQSILRKAFEGKLVSQDPSEEPASQLLERIKGVKKNPEKGVEQLRLDKW